MMYANLIRDRNAEFKVAVQLKLYIKQGYSHKKACTNK